MTSYRPMSLYEQSVSIRPETTLFPSTQFRTQPIIQWEYFSLSSLIRLSVAFSNGKIVFKTYWNRVRIEFQNGLNALLWRSLKRDPMRENLFCEKIPESPLNGCVSNYTQQKRTNRFESQRTLLETVGNRFRDANTLEKEQLRALCRSAFMRTIPHIRNYRLPL